ncbi:hypothetical protein [Neomoorella thermoacetica]|uniref:hypothetical protein n=1 Tax=Neomoorella thermoacetica TaxID=1525 RepID=UPI0009231AFA|nr:hypothetical protein [Moorella thermoacetica]OIQ53412.1 hypothetical protein MORE_21400 [Moorella thermoacetica]
MMKKINRATDKTKTGIEKRSSWYSKFYTPLKDDSGEVNLEPIGVLLVFFALIFWVIIKYITTGYLSW